MFLLFAKAETFFKQIKVLVLANLWQPAVTLLQGYQILSTEYHIGDSLSFMNFLDLQMGDNISDAKTIRNFKEFIEKEGRDESN